MKDIFLAVVTFRFYYFWFSSSFCLFFFFFILSSFVFYYSLIYVHAANSLNVKLRHCEFDVCAYI